jgi:hypothetical protein
MPLPSGDGACRGRIVGTHRIVQKNKKKRAQALEVFPAPVKPTPAQTKPKLTVSLRSC